MLGSLKEYIEENVKDDNKYYVESFCMLTLDYFGMKGEFTKEDIRYIKSKGFTVEDFIEG